MATLRNLATASLLIVAASALSFDVSAKSAIIMDEATGKILWERDAYTPRHPASTTKIMTAMLLLEGTLPADKIVAPKGVEKYPETSLHLRPGEIVSAKGLLHAILMRSANDGCVAVAHHLSGSVANFAKRMNLRAREIGCLNTNFANPNGLTDPKHLTTAYDLALIAREAMKYEEFRQVVRTQKYTITRSVNQKDLAIKNSNKWLAKDSSADGIKTGYTKAAGRCYVGSATRDGYRLITVILKSEDWQKDHQQMLSWAFENHYREQIAKPGSEFAKVALPNAEPGELSVTVSEPVERLRKVGPGDEFVAKPTYIADLQAPIQAGQTVGSVTFSDASGWSKTVELVATNDVALDPPLLATIPGRIGFGILTGTLAIGAFGNLARSRRRKPNAKIASSYF